MREIKFRAWDQKNKVIVTDFTKNHKAMLDCIGDLFTHVDYQLMQFTGLRDKNGKEIYEGDIVRDDGYAECRDMVVSFDEATCCFTRDPKNNTHFQLSKHRTWMYEVIGNIHETPGLLAPQTGRGEA